MLPCFTWQLARPNLTEMAILLFFRNYINIVLNFPDAEKSIYSSAWLLGFIQVLARVQLLALFQPQLPMIQFLDDFRLS